jgi:uncharacterized membrane protein
MVLRVVVVAMVVLLFHALALTGRPAWCLAIMLAGAVAALVYLVVRRRPKGLIAAAAATVLVLGPLVGLAFLSSPAWAKAIFVPPVLINLAVAIIFGLSLRPGQVPLVTRLAIIHHDGDLPPPLFGYTRLLTVMWTAVTGIMAVEAALLALFVDLSTWSWIVSVANPAILITLFFGQFWYRSWRYRAYGKVTVSGAIRKIAAAGGAWTHGGAGQGDERR